MNNDKFNKLVKNIFININNLLITKNKDYSEQDKDRLSNFKLASKFRNKIPEQVLIDYVTKHITTLFNNIDILNKNSNLFNIDINLSSTELKKYDEYIYDIINYMILLKALLTERSC